VTRILLIAAVVPAAVAVVVYVRWAGRRLSRTLEVKRRIRQWDGDA
jgi:flagellar basal body-associated protein FliL